MNAAEFVSRLPHPAKKAGDGYKARCPAHDDHDPSLSIKDGEKGLVIKCHVGCSPEAILGAMGLTWPDVLNGNGAGKPKIAATYDYMDESGKLLFQVCRLDPKDFRQRKPDGSAVDGWTWSTKGVRRVLFHLPQVLEAVQQGRPVYVCEGEKDVLKMESAGFAATCNPGGAGKWQPDFSKALTGAAAVIIADRDEPGRKHAADVASKLQGIAASIKVLELPDVNGKPVKDASDYFAAGGHAADLDALAETTPQWNPEDDAEKDPWLALAEDGADLQVRSLPPVVEIVEGIVAERSKLVIGSGSKSFKTWLSMDMGLSIAHESAVLERQTNRRRVLYVNLELKPETFTRRLQAIAEAKHLTIDRAWFTHLPLRGKMSGAAVHDVITRLIRLALRFKAGVVIADPIYKMNLEGEENDSRDQTLFFNELDRLTTEAGCTLILNDHFSKGNQSEKDPLDAIRGSSAKGGDVDAAMVLRRHEVQDCFRVDMVHRELPPVSPFCIGWEYPLMRFRSDLDPDKMKKAKGGRKPGCDPKDLLAAIIDSTVENPVSVSTWAKVAGIERTTLYHYLPQFRIKGWISTAGEGNSARQYLTEKGKLAVRVEA